MSRSTDSIWSIPLATLGIMALCIFVYAAQVVLDLELHHYTMNPRMIIHLQEYYRFVTSCLFHGGLMHIGMNMMSTAAISTMLEKRVGTLQQIMTIAWAMLLTSSLYTLVSLFLHIFLGRNNLMYSHSVGFSGVLFHLSVMECNMTPHRSRSVFGFLSVPAYLYPWALLVALQMFITNLSFAGHLSGILTGTLQSFGAFDFLFVSQAYLQEMEKWHSLSHLTTLPNFVATPALLETTVQQRDSPVRLLAAARSGLHLICTFCKNIAETIKVCIFGRGNDVNGNIQLGWPSQTVSTEVTLAVDNEGFNEEDDWVGLPPLSDTNRDVSRIV
mmetsp:Transcript_7872/g.14321  ORF Transcript_7872/g.14321 Transcript_7872/m.14321 type:complete len:329 (+) Transcript_7872:2-988(+)